MKRLITSAFLNLIRAMVMLSLILVAETRAQDVPQDDSAYVEIEGSADIGEALDFIFGRLDRSQFETGILYDMAVHFVDIPVHTGDSTAPPLNYRDWSQMYHEMYTGSFEPKVLPSIDEVEDTAHVYMDDGVIPLLIADIKYDAIRPDALEENLIAYDEDGRLVDVPSRPESPVIEKRLFIVSGFRDSTLSSHSTFQIGWPFYFSNDPHQPGLIEIDFDDGLGFREAAFDQTFAVDYASDGDKLIRIKISYDDGWLESSFNFRVKILDIAQCDSYMATGSDYPSGSGECATVEACVYCAPGHTVLTKPFIFVEGFDVTNERDCPQLYSMLSSGANFVAALHAEGYDLVIVNLLNPHDYIQRNAFALLKLLDEISIDVENDCSKDNLVIAGASMGGLAVRYALAYAEQNDLNHHTRLFISFDAPHKGANVPLGAQHFVDYFAGMNNKEAAKYRDIINSDAARQMMMFYYNSPNGYVDLDPLHTEFFNELAALNNWTGYPKRTRNVAIANGSGHGVNYDFDAGEKVVHCHQDKPFLTIDADVWAVGISGHDIFKVRLSGFLWSYTYKVAACRIPAVDNCPGGGYDIFKRIDEADASNVAYYQYHSFIPTISSLDFPRNAWNLDFSSLDEDYLLNKIPFDDAFYAEENEFHTTLSVQCKDWIMDQLSGIPLCGEESDDKDPDQMGPLSGGMPYVVTCNVSVPPGKNLTVDPGTEIRFRSGFKMTAYGCLLVKGTADCPVRLISEDPPHRETRLFGQLRLQDGASIRPGP